MNLGEAGVDVFFVISGFLITSLMLREHDRQGRISLAGFYRRRSLRIFPAYFFFLFFVFVLSHFGWLPMNNHAWPYLLTYTYNLNPHLGAGTIGHVWSLCVEEHFYLLWPLTVVLFGVRRAPFALYGCIFIAPILRFWLYLSHSRLNIDFFTPTRLDTIAVGCLLAFAFRQPWLRYFRRGWVATCAGLVFLASVFLVRSGKYELGPEHFVEASMIAVMIAFLVRDANGPVGRFLNWRPVVWIGTLSYSIYLGQTLVVGDMAPLWARIPAVMLYACFSYYVIESPFLKLKDRVKAPVQKVEQRAAGV